MEAMEITVNQDERLKALEDVLRELLAHEWAEDCQECAIGRSDAWAKAKALLNQSPPQEEKGK